MEDGTSLLFDLDGFRVASVVRSALGVRVVTIAGVAAEQACPNCGVYSHRVHSRWTQAVTDLPTADRCRCAGTSGGSPASSRPVRGARLLRRPTNSAGA